MKLTAKIITCILLAIFLIAPWFYNDLFWKFCADAFMVLCILVAIMVKRK